MSLLPRFKNVARKLSNQTPPRLPAFGLGYARKAASSLNFDGNVGNVGIQFPSNIFGDLTFGNNNAAPKQAQAHAVSDPDAPDDGGLALAGQVQQMLDNFKDMDSRGKHWVSLSRPEDFTTEATYAATRLPIEDAWTLNPSTYVNPAYWEVELEKVWKKNWVAVGHTSELKNPGDVMTANIGNQSILLTKDKRGKINAFYNTCRHRGTTLVTEKRDFCKKKMITCPYHHWCYSLDGELLASPDFSPKKARGKQKRTDFDRKKFNLLPIHVDTWGSLVFVHLGSPHSKPPPLLEQIGSAATLFENYPQHEMSVERTREYNAKANWKLLAENFLEWYHLNAVHPSLKGVSSPKAHQSFSSQTARTGKWTGFRTYPFVDGTGSPIDSSRFQRMPGLTGEEPQQLAFFHIYPNVSMSLYPHSAYSLIMLPHPEDPMGRTQESLHALSHPASRLPEDSDETYQKKIDEFMEFVCTVNDEDVEIVEKVQTGVRNGTYPGGRFAPILEYSVYDLQNYLIDDLVRAEAA